MTKIIAPSEHDDNQAQQKCLLIALIGAPNAGKSTLLNVLVGQTISIATHKAQTTRRNLKGIVLMESTQLVFVDTPGIFKPEGTLERHIVKEAWRGVDGADLVCFLLDASRSIDENAGVIIEHLKRHNKKACAIFTKVDKIAKPLLLEKAMQLEQFKCFDQIFMISALKHSGLKELMSYLDSQALSSPWLFHQDDLTDRPLRELAAEITMEQLFLQLHNELPYSMKVETDTWKGEDTTVEIHQTLYVNKESQRRIVIGSKGQRLKMIGMKARQQIAQRFGLERVRLFLHVKISPDWIEQDYSKG